jgi:hypothetical protein
MKKFLYDLLPWFATAGMLLVIGVWWYEILMWTTVHVTFPVLKFALWFGGGSTL